MHTKKWMVTAAFIAITWVSAIGQVPLKVARILVVVSDNMVMNACPPCASPWDWYHNNYLTIIDEWNATYENSGMDYRVELAGVIWDKTYNDQVSGTSNLDNITYPGHPVLGKYHNMLSAFAADYLVLHSWADDQSNAGGYASPSVPNIGNPATFWVREPSSHPWIHEAGHKHGLIHCDGYRQTYDANNNPVNTGAVWGFHTVMQAIRGTAESCPQGDKNIDATFAFEFADPGSTLDHQGVFPLGGPSQVYTIQYHISADQDIRSLFSTQSSVELTPEMSVDNLEYANIIAINKITLKSGFRVNSGGNLKISVGNQVMAKRGVPEGYHLLRDEDKPEPHSAQKIQIHKSLSQGWYEIKYLGPSHGNISLIVSDISGKVIQAIPNIMNSGKGEAFSIYLGNQPNNIGLISITAGKERFFKQVRL